MSDFIEAGNNTSDSSKSAPKNDPDVVDDIASVLSEMAGDSMRGRDELLEESLSQYVGGLSRTGTLTDVANMLESQGKAVVDRDKNGQVSELVFSDPFGRTVDVDIKENGEVFVNDKAPKELREQSVDKIVEFYQHNMRGWLNAGELSLSDVITLDTLYKGLLTNDPNKISEAAKKILAGETDKFARQIKRELGFNSDISIMEGKDGRPAVVVQGNCAYAVFSRDGSVEAFDSALLEGKPDYSRPSSADSADHILRYAADLGVTGGESDVLTSQRVIIQNVLNLAHETILNDGYGEKNSANIKKLTETLKNLPKEQLDDVAQFLDNQDSEVERWRGMKEEPARDMVHVNVVRDKTGAVSDFIIMAKAQDQRHYPARHLTIPIKR